MENAGDAFASAFRDPQWVGKFLVMGLITLIPIVGAINLWGWALTIADYRRAGYWGLPPANLSHLGRGMEVFVAFLVYGVVFVALFFGVFALFVLGRVASAANAGLPGSGAAALLSSSAMFGLWSLGSLVYLAFILVTPTIVVQVEHGGIGAGLNLLQTLRWLTARPGPVLLAGFLVYAGQLVSSLGIVLCCVGIILTLPYAYVVIGEMVFRLERALGLGPPPRFLRAGYPPPPPPPPAPWQQPTPGY